MTGRGAGDGRGTLRRCAKLLALSAGLALLLHAALPPAPTPPVHPLLLAPEPRTLPLLYWIHRNYFPEAYKGNASCAQVPRARQLRVAPRAPLWQAVGRLAHTHVYAAHWDARTLPTVRVLLYTGLTQLPQLYCQFWFYSAAEPVVAAAQALHAWAGEARAGDAEPFVVSCRAPGAQAPAAVSLVRSPCAQPTNVLNVQGMLVRVRWAAQGSPMEERARAELQLPPPPPPPPAPAVCAAWLEPPQDKAAEHRRAQHFIEWVELLRAFGVRSFMLYLRKASAPVMEVVDRYMTEGLVEVVPFELPPVSSAQSATFAKRSLLPLNDCLYRALHRGRAAPSAWIGALSPSELIVPVRDGTWAQLTAREAETAEAGAPDALRLRSAARAGECRPKRQRGKEERLDRCTGELERGLYKAANVVAALPWGPLWCLAPDGGPRACRSRVLPASAAHALRFAGLYAGNGALAPWRRAAAVRARIVAAEALGEKRNQL